MNRCINDTMMCNVRFCSRCSDEQSCNYIRLADNSIKVIENVRYTGLSHLDLRPSTPGTPLLLARHRNPEKKLLRKRLSHFRSKAKRRENSEQTGEQQEEPASSSRRPTPTPAHRVTAKVSHERHPIPGEHLHNEEDSRREEPERLRHLSCNP